MKKFFILFSLLTLNTYLFSQIEATTKDGRKVILNGDGTWKYVESSGTSGNLDGVCEFRINQSNEASGEVKRYTKLVTIAKDKSETFKVSLRRENDKRFIVGIYTGDLGCVNKESKMVIRFFNGEVVQLTNYGNEGCESGEAMFFKLDLNTMTKLQSSPFLRIRITGTDFFADLAPLQPNFFVNKIKCIE